MKKLGMTQPLLLCEAATELAFRTTAQNMGDGAYIAMTQNSPYDTKDPKFAEFAKRWSQKYASQGYSDVLLTHPHGFQFYDAMLLLAKVIEKYGKEPKKIREGLENIGPFKGISGIEYVITKDKHCACSHLPVRMWKFDKGRILPAE
jgi:ABC-type branched-subunit amino acid transport system substrate-binding protein